MILVELKSPFPEHLSIACPLLFCSILVEDRNQTIVDN